MGVPVFLPFLSLPLISFPLQMRFCPRKNLMSTVPAVKSWHCVQYSKMFVGLRLSGGVARIFYRATPSPFYSVLSSLRPQAPTFRNDRWVEISPFPSPSCSLSFLSPPISFRSHLFPASPSRPTPSFRIPSLGLSPCLFPFHCPYFYPLNSAMGSGECCKLKFPGL